MRPITVKIVHARPDEEHAAQPSVATERLTAQEQTDPPQAANDPPEQPPEKQSIVPTILERQPWTVIGHVLLWGGFSASFLLWILLVGVHLYAFSVGGQEFLTSVTTDPTGALWLSGLFAALLLVPATAIGLTGHYPRRTALLLGTIVSGVALLVLILCLFQAFRTAQPLPKVPFWILVVLNIALLLAGLAKWREQAPINRRLAVAAALGIVLLLALSPLAAVIHANAHLGTKVDTPMHCDMVGQNSVVFCRETCGEAGKSYTGENTCDDSGFPPNYNWFSCYCN